ncbi:hypothetical protein PARU111607_04855 [Palleronia rufa]
MVSFDSASRIRPSKLSTNPFCMGLPGAMNAARCPVWRQRLRSRCRSVRCHCRTRSCPGCRVARSDGPGPGQHAVRRSMCPVAPRDSPGSRRRRRSGRGTGGRRPADRGRNRATSGRWAAPRPGSGHMCRWPCAGHGVCARPALPLGRAGRCGRSRTPLSPGAAARTGAYTRTGDVHLPDRAAAPPPVAGTTDTGPSCGPPRRSGGPADPTDPTGSAHARRLHARRWALPFFCQQLLRRRRIEHLLRQQLLQLGLPVRKRFQPSGIPPNSAFQA